MQTLRVMAVDDEELAHRRVKLALSEMPGFELVAAAYSGRQAADMLAAARPDIVLLDVEMAGGGGVQFAAGLRGAGAPAVVFVTAFEAYAVEAFEVRAVDYVLKPVRFDRLAVALENARAALRLARADRTAAALQRVIERAGDAGQGQRQDHIWAQAGRQDVRLSLTQVDWFEAEGDYVRVHVGPRSYLMRGPLNDIAAGLEPGDFIRIRRSALVRVEAIQAFRRVTPIHRRVVLISGREVRVGKTYFGAVERLLGRA